MNQQPLIVVCKVVHDLFDYDLMKYVSPNLKDYTAFESINGYYYFDVDGLTITFFSPIESDELIYHIVICELEYEVIADLGQTYDSLISQPHIFTFNESSVY